MAAQRRNARARWRPLTCCNAQGDMPLCRAGWGERVYPQQAHTADGHEPKRRTVGAPERDEFLRVAWHLVALSGRFSNRAVNKKVEPHPGRLSTSISPPIIRASWLEMASPNPVAASGGGVGLGEGLEEPSPLLKLSSDLRIQAGHASRLSPSNNVNLKAAWDDACAEYRTRREKDLAGPKALCKRIDPFAKRACQHAAGFAGQLISISACQLFAAEGRRWSLDVLRDQSFREAL
jgi:hypothetical protein